MARNQKKKKGVVLFSRSGKLIQGVPVFSEGGEFIDSVSCRCMCLVALIAGDVLGMCTVLRGLREQHCSGSSEHYRRSLLLFDTLFTHLVVCND
jgi:hypothetical protein